MAKPSAGSVEMAERQMLPFFSASIPVATATAMYDEGVEKEGMGRCLRGTLKLCLPSGHNLIPFDPWALIVLNVAFTETRSPSGHRGRFSRISTFAVIGLPPRAIGRSEKNCTG